MPIDPNRYPLITREFRYATIRVPQIEAAYAKARELEIPTNFRNLPAMVQIAQDLAEVIGVPRLRFEVNLSGTDHINLDDFKGMVPVVHFIAPEFGVDKNFAVTRCVIDENEDSTVLELWG